MKKVSGGQRGGVGSMVLFGLIVAVVIAALGKGCDEQPVVPSAEVAMPPPAPALPAAPPPPPLAEAAPLAAASPTPQRSVPSLIVHNPCDQPLLMAVSFLDENGQRVNEGLFQVAPGARLAPTTRKGPVFLRGKTVHYYTETLASEPVEQGRRDESVAQRQVGMKEALLDPPASSTITLECPGTTSGRP